MSVEAIVEYLNGQGIHTEPARVLPSFLDPESELQSPGRMPIQYAVQANSPIDVTPFRSVEAMSLASMAAVMYLKLDSGHRLLDVCAAPGMKGLYVKMLKPDVSYHCNDVSKDRLARLKRLFDTHDVRIENMTHYAARFIDRAYPSEYFERILVDAPCSGEGVALGGSEELAAAWSPAKVKRLQQLQIKILKSSWQLLQPGGRLVYATCTLNRNENERVVKKALGFTLRVQEAPLSLDQLPSLGNDEAWRILPSANSIGFFIAVIDKTEEID